ncbi:MAG: GldG family protein [Chloroflexi bacterium]|nr:GldG family protein [Chloroflexota bacterium]
MTSPGPRRSPEVGRLGRLRASLSNISLLLAVAGGVALVGGAILFLWVPDIRQFAITLMALAGVFLLLALVSSYAVVRAAVVGRRGRYTTNTFVMITTLLGIVILVNFIAFRNSIRMDTTATRQFTLADQTIKVLAGLKEPIRATAFFVPDQPDHAVLKTQADDLLYEFRRRSQGMFSYRYIDPEKEPGFAKQYEVTTFPAVTFEATDSGKKFTVPAPPVTEQFFTSALLIITGTKQKTIYFLDGHKERNINDVTEGSEGLGFAARKLIQDNYQIRTLTLKQTGKIPEDTAVLVIAGPKSDFLGEEREPLFNYLRDGGRALFLLDPDTPQRFRDLIAEWGIQLGEGFIVDQGSSVSGDPRTPVVQRIQYTESTQITRPLDATFFPGVTKVDLMDSVKESIEKKDPLPIEYLPMAVSSFDSWFTRDPERNLFNASLGDKRGPVAIAMALIAAAPLNEEPGSSPAQQRQPASIVIFGDSDFATNKYFSAYSNGDFFVNAVNWLAEDFNLISLRPKEIVFRELIVTKREFNFIRYSSWFLLPIAVLLLGVMSWWRRR